MTACAHNNQACSIGCLAFRRRPISHRGHGDWRRRFVASEHLPHPLISRLEMATVAVRIEKRRCSTVSLQARAHFAKGGRVMGEPQRLRETDELLVIAPETLQQAAEVESGIGHSRVEREGIR